MSISIGKITRRDRPRRNSGSAVTIPSTISEPAALRRAINDLASVWRLPRSSTAVRGRLPSTTNRSPGARAAVVGLCRSTARRARSPPHGHLCAAMFRDMQGEAVEAHAVVEFGLAFTGPVARDDGPVDRQPERRVWRATNAAPAQRPAACAAGRGEIIAGAARASVATRREARAAGTDAAQSPEAKAKITRTKRVREG